MALNHQVFIQSIQDLIEKQQRCTWTQVHERFHTVSPESFYQMATTDPASIIPQLCQLMRMPQQHFRDYYRYLLSKKPRR